MKTFMPTNLRRPIAMLALAAATVSSQASAETLTWTSTDTGGSNWSDPLNWGGVAAPMDGDTLIFRPPVAGGARATNNDIPGLTIARIETPANAYSVSGNGFTLAGDILQSSGGNSTFTLGVPVTLSTDSTFTVNKTTTQTPAIVANADINGTGGVTLNGGGQFQINTNLSYTGDTRIADGNVYLRLGTLYSGAKGNVTIDAGASLLSNNLSFAIGALDGDGSVSRIGSNSRGISLGSNNASGSFGGSIVWNGGSSSSVNLDGTGTQRFSTTATISTVQLNANSGRLLVDGDATAVGSTTIAASGLLGGTGSLGSTTVNGTLAPGGDLAGDTTAVLAASGLTLNGTTTLGLNGTIREAAYDGVDVGGALVYGGVLNLDFLAGSTDVSNVYDLFNATGPTGSFAAVNLTGGYTGALTNNGSGLWTGASGDTTFAFVESTGDLTVVAPIAIPEPATLTALAGAAGFGLLRRRR